MDIEFEYRGQDGSIANVSATYRIEGNNYFLVESIQAHGIPEGEYVWIEDLVAEKIREQIKDLPITIGDRQAQEYREDK